jgi:hypothetical protein
MSEEKILSFNKRISLAKKEVFDGVTTSKELENIKGTNTTGFYSIATIEKYLYPTLEKFDLDLDMIIEKDKIIGIWFDCFGQSEKTRSIVVDFSRIENIGKLQLMANEVQSEGAVKSYTRRYALSAILRLPSTDLIDSNITQKPNQPAKQQNQPQQNQSPNNPKVNPNPNQLNKPSPIINAAQLKKLFATMNEKGKTEEDINKYIKAKKWPIKSKKEMTNNMLQELLKALGKYPNVEQPKR